MNTVTMHEAIKVCLKQISTNLTEASRLAQAAEACASAGSVAEGVQVPWISSSCFTKQAGCTMLLA